MCTMYSIDYYFYMHKKRQCLSKRKKRRRTQRINPFRNLTSGRYTSWCRTTKTQSHAVIVISIFFFFFVVVFFSLILCLPVGFSFFALHTIYTTPFVYDSKSFIKLRIHLYVRFSRSFQLEFSVCSGYSIVYTMQKKKQGKQKYKWQFSKNYVENKEHETIIKLIIGFQPENQNFDHKIQSSVLFVLRHQIAALGSVNNINKIN